MAVIIGDTAAITWGGTENTALIATGSAPYQFVLNINAAEKDTTPLGTTNAMTYGPGLYEWSGTISSRLAPAVLGEAGIITGASGVYLANLIGWTMEISAPAKEITPVAASATGRKAFAPSIYSWGGTWTANIDSTTALTRAGLAYASAVFRLVDTTTDHTLTGNIVTTGVAGTVQIGEVAGVTYTYKGSGAIATAGSGNPIFPTNPLPRPTGGALVLTSATGRTYTGNAFWERISITVAPDENVSFEIGFRGSGSDALVIA